MLAGSRASDQALGRYWTAVLAEALPAGEAALNKEQAGRIFVLSLEEVRWRQLDTKCAVGFRGMVSREYWSVLSQYWSEWQLRHPTAEITGAALACEIPGCGVHAEPPSFPPRLSHS